MRIKAFFALGLLSIVHAVQAQTGSATGTIQHIYTYGNGMVLITGFNFSGATCSNNGGFYISESHPQFNRLLAVLLSARAMGATLEVVAKIDSCWYPYVYNDASTYFVMQP